MRATNVASVIAESRAGGATSLREIAAGLEDAFEVREQHFNFLAEAGRYATFRRFRNLTSDSRFPARR